MAADLPIMPPGMEVKIVRTWIREHNQQVKASGKGVRILPLFLPTLASLAESH